MSDRSHAMLASRGAKGQGWGAGSQERGAAGNLEKSAVTVTEGNQPRNKGRRENPGGATQNKTRKDKKERE